MVPYGDAGGGEYVDEYPGFVAGGVYEVDGEYPGLAAGAVYDVDE